VNLLPALETKSLSLNFALLEALHSDICLFIPCSLLLITGDVPCVAAHC